MSIYKVTFSQCQGSIVLGTHHSVKRNLKMRVTRKATEVVLRPLQEGALSRVIIESQRMDKLNCVKLKVS